jgi:hypothetical protein
MRVAAFLAVAAIAAGTASAAPPTPRILLASTQPVAVRGVHFRPAERVFVTATLNGDTGRKTVIATATGTFLVRFTALTAEGCTSYFLHARGSDGSTAALHFIPECANGPTP